MTHWNRNAVRDLERFEREKMECKNLKGLLEVMSEDLEGYRQDKNFDAVEGYSIYVKGLKTLIIKNKC